MKKFLAVLSTLVMVGSLASCGDNSSSSNNNSSNDTKTTTAAKDEATEANNNGGEDTSSGKKTVGIAMPTKSLERWNRDGEYLKDQFEAAGYDVDLKYSDNKTEQQNNDIQSMIADKVDLLLIAAIDGDTLSQTLADAKSANIPVIAYDRLIMNTDAVSYYVSFDNYTVGKLQGEFVRDALKLDSEAGPFNIEFTAGDPADNNAGYFFNGAYDALEQYIKDGKLKVPSGKTTFEQVATPTWSTDTALANMQNTLASYYSDGTQLDVALCSNDSTALGVAQAIASDYSGSNAPLVTGQDGDIANLKNILYKMLADYLRKNRVNVKEMYFNIDDFKNCDLEKLNWEEKYSIILIIIKTILPILNLDKMNNIDITYNNIKNKFCKKNFILTPTNRNINPFKFFLKKINTLSTKRNKNKTISKYSSLSSNFNGYKTNILFNEQNPFSTRSYSLLKI